MTEEVAILVVFLTLFWGGFALIALDRVALGIASILSGMALFIGVAAWGLP